MNILFVSPVPPWPATRGGNQRTNLIYRALSELGTVDLILLCSDKAVDSESEQYLKEHFRLVKRIKPASRGSMGIWGPLHAVFPFIADRLAHNLGSHSVHYVPDRELARWLTAREETMHYHLYVGRYLIPAGQAGFLERTPTIVDIDDLDTQKYQSRIEAPGIGFFEKLVLMLHVNKFKRAIRPMMSKIEHMWVTNETDLHTLPERSKSVLPNIPYQDEKAHRVCGPSDPASIRILAVCSMAFDVNERGVDYFFNQIWPLIIEECSEAQFELVGSNMTSTQKERWGRQKNTTVHGFVEDLADVYETCAFTITPVFEGGGSKIKVAESLLYNRTAVISQHAYRGYEDVLKDGDSLLVGHDAEQFARHCLTLLRDPDLRNKLEFCGSRQVKSHLSYDSFAKNVATTVKTVLRDAQ